MHLVSLEFTVIFRCRPGFGTCFCFNGLFSDGHVQLIRRQLAGYQLFFPASR